MLIAAKAEDLAGRLIEVDEHIARCEAAESQYSPEAEGKPAWLVTLGLEDQRAELALLRRERGQLADALSVLALEAHFDGPLPYAAVAGVVADVQGHARA